MEERKYYHYVFATYNRIFALGNKELQANLTKWFRDIAKEKHIEIISLNILADHVHMLIEQKNNDSPAYIMKCIKGISSRMFFKYYADTNRLLYRKLWGRSYYCKEVPPDTLKKVVNYINDQNDKSGMDKRFNSGVRKEPRRSVSGS